MSYKAKGELSEELKTNEDLQTFFHHVYPGAKILDLYRTLYGDPNTAIVRKRFTEDVKCVAEGQSTLVLLDNYKRSTNYGVGDITKPGRPSTGKPIDGKEAPERQKRTLRLFDNLEIDLDDKSVGRQPRNIISNFYEAVRGTRASSINTEWD